MRSVIISTCLFLSTAVPIVKTTAQERDTLLNNIECLWHENRDIEAITQLEAFERKYPTNYLLYSIKSMLSNLYLENGQPEKAIQKRIELIHFEHTDREHRISEASTLFLVKYDYYPTLKARTSVIISEMFQDQLQKDSAFKYLALADNCYLLELGCGNAIMMHRSDLSFDFCRFYLRFGDTTAAIQRLLHYFLEEDGDAMAVSEKLKELLLTRYSQEEINAAIENAIRKSRINRDYNEYGIIYFTLFGEKLRTYVRKKHHKENLRNIRYIKILTG
jgi:hypothetical protein